jgi:hypothetical protein
MLANAHGLFVSPDRRNDSGKPLSIVHYFTTHELGPGGEGRGKTERIALQNKVVFEGPARLTPLDAIVLKVFVSKAAMPDDSGELPPNPTTQIGALLRAGLDLGGSSASESTVVVEFSFPEIGMEIGWSSAACRDTRCLRSLRASATRLHGVTAEVTWGNGRLDIYRLISEFQPDPDKAGRFLVALNPRAAMCSIRETCYVRVDMDMARAAYLHSGATLLFYLKLNRFPGKVITIRMAMKYIWPEGQICERTERQRRQTIMEIIARLSEPPFDWKFTIFQDKFVFTRPQEQNASRVRRRRNWPVTPRKAPTFL